MKNSFEELYSKASELVENSRDAIGYVANMLTVYANFQMGKYIVEEEQKGDDRAKYGAKVLDLLSEYLTEKYGRGCRFR